MMLSALPLLAIRAIKVAFKLHTYDGQKVLLTDLS